MRDAMATAEVGDDVYGEDPTVARLEAEAARRLGKPAAVLVPSGTMGNQASLRSLTRPGDTVLVGENAHLLVYEGGAPAARIRRSAAAAASTRQLVSNRRTSDPSLARATHGAATHDASSSQEVHQRTALIARAPRSSV